MRTIVIAQIGFKEASNKIIEILRDLILSQEIDSLDINQIGFFLNDLLHFDPNKKKHINLLLLFAKSKYFIEVRNINFNEITFRKYAKSFQDDYGLAEENAFWTLLIWLSVFGLISKINYNCFFDQINVNIHKYPSLTDKNNGEKKIETGNEIRLVSTSTIIEQNIIEKVILDRNNAKKSWQRDNYNIHTDRIPIEFVPHLRKQIEHYIFEINHPKPHYYQKPLLIIENDQLDIRALVDTMLDSKFNDLKTKNYNHKRGKKYPIVVSCLPLAENFLSSF